MQGSKTYQNEGKAKGFRSLIAYQKSLALAIEINSIVNDFPNFEKYSLSDQIRRSSRSVCACIGEAYRKRQYPNHFKSKLSDADMENTETQVWFDVALGCELINREKYDDPVKKSEEVGRILSYMIDHPEKFQPLQNTENNLKEPLKEYLLAEIELQINEMP